MHTQTSMPPLARLWTILLTGLFVSGLAYAQSSPDAQPVPAGKGQAKFDRHFAQTDKNGDGYISREEAAAHPMLAKNFDAMDTDHDGKLSREELQAHHGGLRGKHDKSPGAKFKAADKDGDGSLSKQEAQDAGLRHVVRNFNRLDVDQDGKLTPEELRAGRRQAAQPDAAK